jgi:ABC-type glycerol-3-phosphate transport system permease component
VVDVAAVGTAVRARSRARLGKVRTARALIFLTLCAVAVVMLYPFAYMVESSFRSETEFENATGFSLSSWRSLFDNQPILREILNSLIVCSLAVLAIITISTAAGYSFAKINYRARTLAFVGVVSCMFVPVPSIIIPEYINVSHFELLGSYWGAAIVYTAVGLPFAVFLMTIYFRGLPDEIIEAAALDGVPLGHMWWRIGVPLAKPAMFTVGILQFIQIWNDLLVALLFIQNTNDRTVTVGIALLSSGRVTSVPVLMAGSVMSVLPPIAVYLCFQKYLVRGITMGLGK